MADGNGIDWTKLSWRRPGSDSSGVKLVVTGDWAPIRHFDGVMKENPVGIYGDTLDVLKSADCRIVNLEGTMYDGTPIVKSGPNLRGGPEHWPCFDAPGFDAATLGNNHVLDFGVESFHKTLNALKERGVKYVGAGMDAAEATRPLVLDVKGVRIGVVSFTEGHDLTAATESKPGVFGWDLALAEQRIGELKRQCDAVIAIPHAGAEYIPFPPAYIQDAYRRLADAGADAVVAHHPHVPQGIEFRNGAPIFYSLGNYVFYQPVNFYYRKFGFLLEVEVAKNSGVTGFKLHPYWICDRGLSLLKGERYAEFSALMRKLTEPLPGRGVEAWNADLKARWNRGYVQDSFHSPLKTLDEDPRAGAAKWLNKFVTVCHYQYYIDTLKRVADGTIDDVPEDLYQLATAYNDTKIPPELQ